MVTEAGCSTLVSVAYRSWPDVVVAVAPGVHTLPTLTSEKNRCASAHLKVVVLYLETLVSWFLLPSWESKTSAAARVEKALNLNTA